MVLQINGTNVVNTDRSITLGTATPGAPVTGMMRYNSTLPEFQVYDGAAWVPFKKVVGGSAATLYSAGSNNNGQLGDATGSTASKSSPVAVVGGFTDWVSISANGPLGIRANGTMWAWGFNASGQIGDNSVSNRSSPVSVVGGFTNWIHASAGTFHSLGIRANGILYAWGSNGNGRLGDNSIVDKSSPVSVVGGFVDWVSARGGGYHSVGVRANGTLWAWGQNSVGQLGDNTGSTASKSSPVAVVGGFTDWVMVSTTSNHVLGVRANGTLWAWGNGTAGRLGDNSIVAKSSPVSVVGGFVDWVSASAGSAHSLGIRANGTMWAWGDNAGTGPGRLGNNNTAIASSLSPISVVGGFTDWVTAGAGGNHSIGVRANGTLWTWGGNLLGRLGDNSTTNRSSPVSVVGGFTDWVSADATGANILGLRG